ncbi:XdhC family protein [Salinisphaera sp. SPP-AMP-43]
MTNNPLARHDWPLWPTYGLEDDILPTLQAWAATHRHAALATLVHISGSSPRPLGSEMAIAPDGAVIGYVSGGCVESTVAAEAQSVLETGEPKMLDYGAGSPVLDVQLTCGGRIGILVTRIDDLHDWVATRQAARTERRELFFDIDLATGHRTCHEASETALPAGTFRQHYPPPARLMLVGGDPVTLAICELAGTLGLEVGLIRAYGPTTPPPGRPLNYYDNRPLTQALPDMPLDAWSAVYSLTHDLDDDQTVLEQGLRSPAFRVGVLGSRRKADERLAKLRAIGFDEADIERLNMPAGLPIHAANPREIALSVLAEITARRPRPAPRVGA